MEATAGFNAKHQQIVFGVTREFHALTAVRGKVAAARASLAAAHSLEDAATARKQNELATLPEVLQAQEETARATYDLEDALAAEHDAHMALLETIWPWGDRMRVRGWVGLFAGLVMVVEQVFWSSGLLDCTIA